MVSLLASLLALGSNPQALPLRPTDGDAPAPMAREFRAAWVATVDNIDWPSSRGLPTATQRAEMLRILDVAQGMRLNAIVLQVRPSADALYPSKLEPWSAYLTGRSGKAPSPYWDPLAEWVAEAHRRGIELHCWFNPYRAKAPAEKTPVAANHVARTHPEVVKPYGPYLWMDPSEPFVQKRSKDVILDVVRRYDVDGVHLDDYFYPYQEKDKSGRLIAFPDSPSYARYRARGGRSPRTTGGARAWTASSRACTTASRRRSAG